MACRASLPVFFFSQQPNIHPDPLVMASLARAALGHPLIAPTYFFEETRALEGSMAIRGRLGVAVLGSDRSAPCEGNRVFPIREHPEAKAALEAGGEKAVWSNIWKTIGGRRTISATKLRILS